MNLYFKIRRQVEDLQEDCERFYNHPQQSGSTVGKRLRVKARQLIKDLRLLKRETMSIQTARKRKKSLT